MPRLVPCLAQIRTEGNATWPGRDRSSDGWIADAAHAARNSDHNADERGLVHALDFDVVPNSPDDQRPDANAMLRATIGDERLQYIIHNGRIWSRSWGWAARKYNGANPHTGHIHFSSRYGSVFELDATPYGIGVVLAAPVRNVGDGGPVGLFPYPTGHVIAQDGGRRVTVHDGSAVYAGRHEKHTVYPIQREVGAKVDGRYGPVTAQLVETWQRRAASSGLRPDGIVGPLTWAAMTRR